MAEEKIYQPVRPPRSRRINIRGVDYHLSEWGDPDRSPIVFLHGWGDTGTTFQFVVDAFADDPYIVAPDFRGFGRSEHTGPAYWFPDYLADLDRLLEVLSPSEPVALIGHSMGGNVAGLYAGIRPERVRGLINIEGFGLKERDPAEAPAHYRKFLERSRELAPFTTYDDYDGLIERMLKRSPRLPIDRARLVAREWASRAADGRVRLAMDPAHKLPNGVLYRRAEAEACWRAVTARVLLIYGSDTDFLQWDEFAPWTAEDPADRPFPGAEVECIPESGHMLHFEAPETLAAVIERFLRDL